MNRIWRISCVGLLVALVLSLAPFLPVSSSPVLADDSFDPESLVGGHDEILVAGDVGHWVYIYDGVGKLK